MQCRQIMSKDIGLSKVDNFAGNIVPNRQLPLQDDVGDFYERLHRIVVPL